jgi:hypothetical protein
MAPKKDPISTAVGKTIELIRVSFGEIIYKDTQQPRICVKAFKPCEMHCLKELLKS